MDSEPETYKVAIQSRSENEWRKAMDSEINSLKKQQYLDTF